MSITIQDAIKAMDLDKVAKCLLNDFFYRLRIKAGLRYYELSYDINFSIINIKTEDFGWPVILSEWEIVEQEERPKPCIFCDNMVEISDKYAPFKIVKCIFCSYQSSHFETKAEAIRKHNEIYDRLNSKTEVSDEETV